MDLAALSIRRPIFIICLFFLVLAIGWISMRRMPVDLFPDVTFPVVVVSTSYRGAAPLEIETLVSKPVEDELSGIAGLKSLHSSSKEGISVVVAEFELGSDIEAAEQQVRDRVSFAKRKLPDDVDEPIIRRVDPADQPIMMIGIEANLSPAKLYDLADEVIKPKIQQVDHVGLVEVRGGRKREIRVELDQKKLENYQLSATLVADRIAQAGENIPAGSVEKGSGLTVYRTLAEFKTLNDIRSVILKFFANEHAVRVADVGEVVDDLEDETSRIFVNGKASLTLQIYKQSGSNTVEVVDAVKKKMEAINREFHDQSAAVTLKVIQDNAKRIRANISDVQDTILIGIILVVLVVLLFLGNFRSTIITGLALPNSLLGAFIFIYWMGFSINIMTLLALTLVVGLLIDDAIVVRENIFRHMEMGKSSHEASLIGTHEVLLAVIATTLSVVAVFGPIAFLQGMVAGQNMVGKQPAVFKNIPFC